MYKLCEKKFLNRVNLKENCATLNFEKIIIQKKYTQLYTRYVI